MTFPDRLPLTGVPVAGVGRRSAALGAWGTAHLQGQVTSERAIRAVTGSDEPHIVDGLQVGTDLVSLFADLRERRAEGLKVVLPVPGDPRGLPGPGTFTDQALRAGEAVRTQGGGAACGLVPAIIRHGNDSDGYAVSVRWRIHRAPDAAPEPAGTQRQAAHDLADALRVATTALTRLDAAQLRPEAADALRHVGSDNPALRLPPEHPAHGVALWTQAERLAAFLDIAAQDDGAAIDRSTVLMRREVLRDLAAAVRRAKVAAINAPMDLPAD